MVLIVFEEWRAPMKEASRPCIRLVPSFVANPLGQRVVNFFAHVLGQERVEPRLAGARRRLDETLGLERRYWDLEVAQQLPRSNVRDRALVLGTLGRVRDLVHFPFQTHGNGTTVIVHLEKYKHSEDVEVVFFVGTTARSSAQVSSG